MILAVLLSGCVRTAPHPEYCGAEVRTLPREALSSLGFTADEMLAWFTEERASWEVRWSKPEGAAPQTLTFTVSEVFETREVTFRSSPDGPSCPTPATLEADLDLAVESADGELRTSGSAVLSATSLDGPFADLSFEHVDVVLGPVAASAVEAELPDGVTASALVFSSTPGILGLSASWDTIDDAGSATVYRCVYQGSRNAELSDCLGMTAP